MKDARFRSAFEAGAVTPQDVLAFHQRAFGTARMEDPPERPEGVSEEEWDALGDPGKRALQREREARQAAERERDEAKRAKPAPPKAAQQPAGQNGQQQNGAEAGQPDLAKIIADAVSAAVGPLQQQQEQWLAERKAEGVRDAVARAAQGRFHDATDALANVDLAALVDDSGNPDQGKVTSALDDLLKTKPHLAVTDTRRRADSPIGASPPSPTSEADRVKAVLAQMQAATGVRLPSDS